MAKFLDAGQTNAPTTLTQRDDQAYVMFFGAFAWDDATFARWSANPLAMLWPETDA